MKPRVIWLIALAVAVGLLWNSGDKLIRAFATPTKQGLRADPLPLPDTFDDSHVIDRSLFGDVRDFTVIDNDQHRWDRAFWPCLEAVLKLSPGEISRRAHKIDFETINERSPEDQAARDALRGTWVRVRGKYIPDTSVPYTQLAPDNPTGRQRVRIGVVVAKQIDEALRLNVPEAWVVYSLDDTGCERNDIVEVEGVFLKWISYESQVPGEDRMSLPMLVARVPRVVEKSAGRTVVKKTTNPRVIQALAALTLLAGLGLMVWVIQRHRKQSRFKNEVLKKIRDKRQNAHDDDSPS